MGTTIRQLDYPAKNWLKSWHEEYEQRRDLRACYVRPPKFSQAQKELAVEHFRSMAAASQRRSGHWAIPEGIRLLAGFNSCIRSKGHASSVDLKRVHLP
jgi:hypothetical protein